MANKRIERTAEKLRFSVPSLRSATQEAKRLTTKRPTEGLASKTAPSTCPHWQHLLTNCCTLASVHIRTMFI
jgi:hypothetical protein